VRALNWLWRNPLYSWRLTSLNGEPVTASNGITLQPVALDDALANADYLITCAGIPIRGIVARWIHRTVL
jgi:transcriptional regulator GlxA family with amidase domain